MSKPLLPAGTETCGCCDSVKASTPGSIDNRTGLSTIGYRIGEYAQFRESLLAALSSSPSRELGALRTRDADDFTIGLLDAVACAADVLTFYQERIANESYLRTATERVSLQEMAKLIGYRLRPGVAAETPLAFALETPKVPPAGSSRDPGSFVTGIPDALTLDVGVKVQSVPGPGEKPQTFETVEEIDARPEWNAMQPWMSEVRAPGYGATETWLNGLRNNLKPGDALLFVGSEFLASPATNNNWDFRLLHSVELEPDNDRTHVTWKRGLGSVTPYANPPVAPKVFALRKRAGVFGNNAPMWGAMSDDFRTNYRNAVEPAVPSIGVVARAVLVPVADDWPRFDISPLPASPTGGHVDLDGLASEVAPGGFAVLAKGEFNRPDESFPSGTYVELYIVTSTAEVSRAEFALSGKVTRLGLRGQNLDTQFFGSVRETSVFTQSEPLAFAAYPVTAAVNGEHLPIAVPPSGLDAGRRLIVAGTRASDGVSVVQPVTVVSTQADVNGAIVTIAPPLALPLKRASVVVYGNVAQATHGETVTQILGSGDAAQSFQRFELKRLPLTYRSAANDLGADSELTVRVGQVEWTEKPTLFETPPTDRAYTVDVDAQGRHFVVFGDGEHGARLPSGLNNIRATYRQGIGRDGNVESNKLTQLVTRPLGLKSVTNPQPAEGGTDPEDESVARRTMPLGTRTLGRAVSLLDYEDFALAFTGVAKAQAQVLQLAAGPTVAITIAGQDGAVVSSTNPVWVNLRAALIGNGDPHVNIALLSYQPSTFRLGLKVKRDPAYDVKAVLAAVEAALRDHFSFDSRSLAQPVYQSDVIAVAQSVPGVVAIDLDFLYGGTSPASQTAKSKQTRLLASRMRVAGGVALPSELLTIDPAAFDRLEEMK